jgi:hypothetical protein
MIDPTKERMARAMRPRQWSIEEWIGFVVPPSRPSPPQPAQLERVSERIGAAIVGFCKAHLGQRFHADELRAHVEKQCGKIAPGSADRILRNLRQRKVIGYRLVSRSGSLYEVTAA